MYKIRCTILDTQFCRFFNYPQVVHSIVDFHPFNQKKWCHKMLCLLQPIKTMEPQTEMESLKPTTREWPTSVQWHAGLRFLRQTLRPATRDQCLMRIKINTWYNHARQRNGRDISWSPCSGRSWWPHPDLRKDQAPKMTKIVALGFFDNCPIFNPACQLLGTLSNFF